jgi:hypothetical protein
MYNSLPALVFKILKKKGDKEVVGKKRLILASLDSEFRIAMHSPFLKASRVTLKVCSSILHV